MDGAANAAPSHLLLYGGYVSSRKKCLFSAIVLAVASHAVVNAADSADDAGLASGEPAATVQILSAPATDLRWFGVGDLASTIQMCVTSTTGRYHMVVTTMETSPFPTGLAFEVSVGSDGNRRVVQHTENKFQLSFEGEVQPAFKCAGTANVSMTLRFRQSELQAAVAGEYLKNLQVSVSPL